MNQTPVVRGYLAELRSTATDRLGSHRSAELVDEIGEHIDAAIAEGRAPEEVIDRLGSPREIVDAEAPAPPVATDGRPLRSQEGIAIALLLVGVLVLVVGWVVGLVLLWTSDRWSTRDKLVGTLLWPAGLGPFLLLIGSGIGGEVTSTSCDDSGCTTDVVTAGWPLWLALTVTVVLVVVPLLTTRHLVRSARVPHVRQAG